MGVAGGSPYSERPLTAVIEARERGDVDFLIARLADTNHEVRGLAAYALQQLESPKALEPLLRLARDSNDRLLRLTAINGVAAIGDPAAASTLVEIASENSLDVRVNAVQALIELGDDRAPGLLADLVSASYELASFGPRPAFPRARLRWALDQLVSLRATEQIPSIEQALPALRFRDRRYARRALKRLRQL
jgi:HEAT repeat protein